MEVELYTLWHISFIFTILGKLLNQVFYLIDLSYQEKLKFWTLNFGSNEVLCKPKGHHSVNL